MKVKMDESLNELVFLIKPQPAFIITQTIMYINVLVFIVTLYFGVNIFSPTAESIIRVGGNFGPKTFDDQYYRFLTSNYIHLGILHLLFNMCGLTGIGFVMEPLYGKLRFIITYMLSGLTGSLASSFWNPTVVSAGASGAIFGLYGFFLISLLFDKNTIDKSARKKLMINTAIFVGYNLLNGLLESGIDNAGHIGGLIGGILIGMFYFLSEKKFGLIKSSVITTAIMVLIMGTFFDRYLPLDIGKFQNALIKLDKNEKEAIETYKGVVSKFKPALKEKYITDIETKCIHLWQENISSLKDLKKLPSKQLMLKDRLSEYCELRYQSCDLLLNIIKSDDFSKVRQLGELNKQIQSKANEIEALTKVK